MRNTALKFYFTGQILCNKLKEQDGQDLVEYAAVIMLVVLALAGGMSTLASGINSAMAGLGAQISAFLS